MSADTPVTRATGEWQLVYDLHGFDVAQFAVYGWAGLVVGVIAVALFVRARRRKTSVMLSLFIGLVAGLLGFGYVAATRDYHQLADRLARDDVLRVEGVVTAHQVWRHDISQPGERPRRYEPWESMVVGGVTFMWPQSSADATFHNANKLPLKDGTWVRIAYVEGYDGFFGGELVYDDSTRERRIVRLELGTRPPLGVSPFTSQGLPTAASRLAG